MILRAIRNNVLAIIIAQIKTIVKAKVFKRIKKIE